MMNMGGFVGVAAVAVGVAIGVLGGQGWGSELRVVVDHTVPVTVPATQEAIRGDERGAESQKTRAALEKTIDLVVEKEEFGKAMEKFAAAAGVRVQLMRKSLEGAGVERDTTVTVGAVKRPARLVLGDMFAELRLHRLGWLIDDDGAVLVGSEDELTRGEFMGVRYYDVSWAVREVEGEVAEKQRGSLKALLASMVDPPCWRDNGGWQSMEVRSQTLVVLTTARNQREIDRVLRELRERTAIVTRAYDVADLLKERGGVALIDTVRTHVARDSWRGHGGTQSSASALGDKLVVTTNVESHAEVERLLKELRAGK